MFALQIKIRLCEKQKSDIYNMLCVFTERKLHLYMVPYIGTGQLQNGLDTSFFHLKKQTCAFDLAIQKLSKINNGRHVQNICFLKNVK